MDYPFNPAPPAAMHLDINSCFATIEQQANPHLRGKPIAVAAYDSPKGCIVAPSVEAKRYGVKTGMRVRDGKLLCPGLIVLTPDPWKYRNVHLALRRIIGRYTPKFSPKSIDEFVLNLADCPIFAIASMENIAKEIKARIKREIGEWITVSVGIAPNRFLAKTAAGLHKPDGLDEISKNNFLDIYAGLSLTDLCGIKKKNTIRLNSMGIKTVLDFYRAPLWKLKGAFHSINGYYWYQRLRGWEVDETNFGRRSYGNSFALPKFLPPGELHPLLTKLTEKMSGRFRHAGYKAGGVHLSLVFSDWSFWHRGEKLSKQLFDSRDMVREMTRLLSLAPVNKLVRQLAVSCFNLTKTPVSQLELFTDMEKKARLVESLDRINETWGPFTVASARMLGTNRQVVDRIAFGGIKELEEFTFR